jgi:hypothetical protein
VESDGTWRYHIPKSNFEKVGVKGSELVAKLVKDIGLSKRVAILLEKRNMTVMFNCIQGLVDSLWLVDRKIFQPRTDDNLIVRSICRKVLKLCISNPCLCVDLWKEFSDWIWFKKIPTQTLEPIIIDSRNFFKKLESIEFLRNFDNRDKVHVGALGEFCSTRHFPFTGKVAVERSWNEFKDLITQDPDDPTTRELLRACWVVGQKARHFHKGNVNSLMEALHFSVTNSGELTNPVSQGGHAKAVMDSMTEWLTEEPDSVMEEIQLYDVRGSAYAGVQRWRTLFRKHAIDDGDFLEPCPGLKNEPGNFRGLDEAFAVQTFYRARELSLSDELPTCRAQYVPEMGNKARWVTVVPWYLQIFQAPAGHLLCDSLSMLPETYSSFHKLDQCWEAIKLFSQREHLPGQNSTLTSDLKNATNALIQKCLRKMFGAYSGGFGFSNKIAEYLSEAVGTVRHRMLISSDMKDVAIAKRGIFMAEPLSKPGLTIHGLAMEMMAYIKIIETPSKSLSFRRIKTDYHQGGDDHAANGPKKYVGEITRNHIRYGSIISKTKHGISEIAIRYTEKVIYVANLDKNVPTKDLDKLGLYKDTIVVDGVKTRLLECGTSVMLSRDQKNVAVGKSGQLVRTMQYLREENGFAREFKESVRNLFISRMGSYLPSRSSHPKLHALVHLPVEWGGYGLGFDDEMVVWMHQAPWPTFEIFKAAFRNRDKLNSSFRPLCAFWSRTMRTTNTNPSTRGVPQVEKYKMALRDRFRENPNMHFGVTFSQLKERYPDAQDNRHMLFLARKDGFMSASDVADKAVRGNIFQSLLMSSERKSFNSEPIEKTYKRVWDILTESVVQTDPIINLTPKDVKILGMSLVNDPYIDTNHKVTFDFGHYEETVPSDAEDEDLEELEQEYDFRELKILDGHSEGKPSLKLKIFDEILDPKP